MALSWHGLGATGVKYYLFLCCKYRCKLPVTNVSCTEPFGGERESKYPGRDPGRLEP